MDELLLDAVCERLIATLSTQGTYIFREGDPVDEMLFIIRGQLESSTTGGGRSGFFNCIILRPGDFCGEELLTWALVPNANLSLPSSTRTIKALTEVEAFALMADDLKFFSSQFKRLHSKALQDAFRYHSHQWRTWGACYVQNAWKRYRRKKMAKELALQESMSYMTDEDTIEDNYSSEENKTLDSPKESNTADSSRHLGATKLASKFAVSARKGATQWGQVGEVSGSATDDLKMPKMFKPDMPDFS